MACPYFFPDAPATRGIHGTPQHAMLPLGDSWTGSCRVVSSSPVQPDDATVRTLCNLGYARGACPRFPDGNGPDASRFTISAAGDALVRIYYVQERDHLPFGHGPLEYSVTHRAFTEPPADALLQRQALAYIESYFRRKAEPRGVPSASH